MTKCLIFFVAVIYAWICLVDYTFSQVVKGKRFQASFVEKNSGREKKSNVCQGFFYHLPLMNISLHKHEEGQAVVMACIAIHVFFQISVIPALQNRHVKCTVQQTEVCSR